MNKYRYVRYHQDGHEEYQCLSCKGYFMASGLTYGNPWKFCPLCGVRWDGLHKCMPADERHERPEPRLLPSVWLIESRDTTDGKQDGWKFVDAMNPRAVKAPEILKRLNELRKSAQERDISWRTTVEEQGIPWWSTEYRARMVSEAYVNSIGKTVFMRWFNGDR